ncbi:unnamed protein product [Hymenolepis diminuta]|uniref:Rho-GAP domain-containing protein n=1 Tax=Hymenolepis diminuta TaxID=6216 RepID=A0A0R3SCA6_HYMDI|nr:unnamed protein product [Hymenolepis diminuta]
MIVFEFQRVPVNASIHPVHRARLIQVLAALHTNLNALANGTNIPALAAVAAHPHHRTVHAPAHRILLRRHQGLAVALHPPHLLILAFHEENVTNAPL